MKAQVLIKPIISEKSLTMASRGWYTFAVLPHSTKKEVVQAVTEQYHVIVRDARSVTLHGKIRRAGRRQMMVVKQDWKKVMVHLEKGQKIDAFEVTTEESTK